jgi:hypothetical protein
MVTCVCLVYHMKDALSQLCLESDELLCKKFSSVLLSNQADRLTFVFLPFVH